MRILLIEGPGKRPAAYTQVVSRALRELGHRVMARAWSQQVVPWAVHGGMRRKAALLIQRVHPDVVHVLSTEPWVAEAFATGGVPVVHTTEGRPSHTDWNIVPTRFALDRIAGAGEGLDYRVGMLPYAYDVAGKSCSRLGAYARVLIDPEDAVAARWVQDAAWRVPFVPVREEGDLRAARFVIAVSSARDFWPEGIARAMSLGRPVLATWGGAAPELVLEGVTGYLSAPGDVDSLARHMEYLWDHPEEALKMGAEARQQALELFDAHAHARMLVRCYLRAGTPRLAV